MQNPEKLLSSLVECSVLLNDAVLFVPCISRFEFD